MGVNERAKKLILSPSRKTASCGALPMMKDYITVAI